MQLRGSARLQQALYADGRWAVLIVLQGMDAAGKDGASSTSCPASIRKAATYTRSRRRARRNGTTISCGGCAKALPARGQIGIFNRSHYEEVLVVRVHPQLLKAEKMPPEAAAKPSGRTASRTLAPSSSTSTRNGTVILKFLLHISKEEQRQRFLAGSTNQGSAGSFRLADVAERKHWDEYMAAYQEMIRETSTEIAPWYVVPADHKHVAWLVVSTAIIAALETLAPKPPQISGAKLKELKAVEQALRAEAPGEAKH